MRKVNSKSNSVKLNSRLTQEEIRKIAECFMRGCDISKIEYNHDTMLEVINLAINARKADWTFKTIIKYSIPIIKLGNRIFLQGGG